MPGSRKGGGGDQFIKRETYKQVLDYTGQKLHQENGSFLLGEWVWILCRNTEIFHTSASSFAN